MSRFRFAWFRRRWWKWILLAVFVLVLPPLCVELHRWHCERLIHDVIVQKGDVGIVYEQRVPDWAVHAFFTVAPDRWSHLVYRADRAIFPKGSIVQVETVRSTAEAVNRLGSIRAAHLQGQQVVEPGVFEALRSWDTVERLYLKNSKITDENLAEIAKLSTLRELILYDTPLSAEGLQQLATLPQLERLALMQTNVRVSEVIPVLQSMPALEEVDLRGTPITTDEKKLLKDALPGVTVIVSPP